MYIHNDHDGNRVAGTSDVFDLVLTPFERNDDLTFPPTPPTTPTTPATPRSSDRRRHSSVFINVAAHEDVECTTPTMHHDAHEQLVHVLVPAHADVYVNYEKMVEMHP